MAAYAFLEFFKIWFSWSKLRLYQKYGWINNLFHPVFGSMMLQTHMHNYVINIKKYIMKIFKSNNPIFIVKCAPKFLFFNEKKIRKILMIFDIENSLWKSNFGTWRQFCKTFRQTSPEMMHFQALKKMF